MSKYDVIIIGSGLGGLTCGATLSKEGYNVCVIEKNPVPGGCFQTFHRNGQDLDTGIHYVGSMDEGEILRQYFTYFGIQQHLKLRRLDENAFDIIHHNGNDYAFAMGHERFAETLTRSFPKEKEAIRQYVSIISSIGDTINVDQLKKGKLSAGTIDLFTVSAWQWLQDITTDKTLQQVLSAPALLYGGEQAVSTLYHHAITSNSYIQGAYRFIDGSMQVTDALVDVIRRNGGTVLTNAQATRLCLADGKTIRSVEINGKEHLETRYVISSLHPANTMELVEKTPLIRKVNLTRLRAMRNSYGMFSVYLLRKKNSTPYRNYNTFIYNDNDVWYSPSDPRNDRIRSCLITMQPTSRSAEYTEVVSLLTPMYINEVEAWTDTTVEHRGMDYKAFKERKAQELIRFTESYFPKLNRDTEKIYTTTPLTYRDYTGTPEGSGYGIIKDYNHPLSTLIPPRTKIENLYLTGQNLNVHGALGVTLTSMLTCAELLGTEYLAKKIGGA